MWSITFRTRDRVLWRGLTDGLGPVMPLHDARPLYGTLPPEAIRVGREAAVLGLTTARPAVARTVGGLSVDILPGDGDVSAERFRVAAPYYGDPALLRVLYFNLLAWLTQEERAAHGLRRCHD